MASKTKIPSKPPSLFFGTLGFLDLIYQSIVREVRTQSGSATFGILKEVGQITMFMAFFYVLYIFMGRSVAIRGDFMMYLLTGIVLMLTHMRAIGSVRSASNATSAIMQHAPMTVILSILANALAGLYLQFVAVAFVVLVLWIFGMNLEVDRPSGLVLPVFFSWASGISIGLLFMVATPLAPGFFNAFGSMYLRLQMITSGKFIPAAYMPSALVVYFAWNPLFHTIDQARQATFINYSSDVTSMSYPIWFTVVALLLGLMGEFWSRKNLSKSKHGLK
ncbi:MAG: ABC transporter permease [Rhodobacteraceae bacterium]|nr:ABC transporter permease [Paracoccaceae bacterium]